MEIKNQNTQNTLSEKVEAEHAQIKKSLVKIPQIKIKKVRVKKHKSFSSLVNLILKSVLRKQIPDDL